MMMLLKVCMLLLSPCVYNALFNPVLWHSHFLATLIDIFWQTTVFVVESIGYEKIGTALMELLTIYACVFTLPQLTYKSWSSLSDRTLPELVRLVPIESCKEKGISKGILLISWLTFAPPPCMCHGFNALLP